MASIREIFAKRREELEKASGRAIGRARRRFGQQRAVFSSFGSPAEEFGFGEIEARGQEALLSSLSQLGLQEAQFLAAEEAQQRARAEADAQRRAARRGGLLGLAGGVAGAALPFLLPGVGTAARAGLSVAGGQLGSQLPTLFGGGRGGGAQPAFTPGTLLPAPGGVFGTQPDPFAPARSALPQPVGAPTAATSLALTTPRSGPVGTFNLTGAARRPRRRTAFFR